MTNGNYITSYTLLFLTTCFLSLLFRLLDFFPPQFLFRGSIHDVCPPPHCEPAGIRLSKQRSTLYPTPDWFGRSWYAVSGFHFIQVSFMSVSHYWDSSLGKALLWRLLQSLASELSAVADGNTDSVNHGVNHLGIWKQTSAELHQRGDCWLNVIFLHL